MSEFTKVMHHIFRHEGGYVDHPDDPGGATNMGICQRDYPDEDICGMTVDRAMEIYREKYWEIMRCDEMPNYLALIVMDCAVNQGVNACSKLLQKAAGVRPDGIVGPVTMHAVLNKPALRMVRDFAAQRAKRYAGTRNFDTFGWGWMKRLFDVTMHSTLMIGEPDV